MRRNLDNMGDSSEGGADDGSMVEATAASEPEATKAGDGNGGGRRVELKKGPWTMTEDTILVEYVKEHGEGNWNTIRKKTGLMRCGKSCRLRWANHLRPNLKKGAFSSQEERLIIELHAKLGNKWARMASQLPGRTDNEIKNFWNTRMKRRQKSNLPLYPDDVQEKATAYRFQRARIEQQQQQQFESASVSWQAPLAAADERQNHLARPPSNLSASYPAPPSNTLQQCQSLSLSSLLYPPQTYHQSLPFPTDNNNSSSGNLTDVLPFTCTLAPSSSLYNYEQPPPHIDSRMPEVNLVPNPLILGPVELDGNGLSMSMPFAMATASSSTSSGGDCMMRPASSSCSDNYEMAAPTMMQGNSGLLDAVLEEARTMLGSSYQKEDTGEKCSYVDQGDMGCGKSHCLVEKSMKVDGNVHGNLVLRDGNHEVGQWDQLSSTGQSSLGQSKTVEDPLEEMDDDLSSLLRDFPSTTMPEPDWYRRSRGGYSDGPPSGLRNGPSGLDETGDVPPPMSPAASAAFSRKNMSGVCQSF